MTVLECPLARTCLLQTATMKTLSPDGIMNKGEKELLSPNIQLGERCPL